jgi:hypothetical protein
MKLSLKILEKNSEVEKAIVKALLPETVSFMNKASSYVKNNINPIIKQSIEDQPEYDSLVNGQLRLELGIPDASQRIEELISAWINNTIVEYKPPQIFNSKIKSSFTIKMIKTDFSDVLNSSLANIERNISGASVPWLQWLLLDGTALLVDNYEVYIGPNSRSRTGAAIMKASEGEGWSMPSQYAGTIADNWITRALDASKPNIQQLLEKALSQ